MRGSQSIYIVLGAVALAVSVSLLGLHHSLTSVVSSRGRNKERKLDKSIREDDELAPQVAWLLAYPCTGSEFFVDVIQQLTGRTTATNYGNLVEEATSIHSRNVYESVPLFTNRENGPYLFTHHLPLPVKTFIPTLSYCGGYCAKCYPGKYIMQRDTFLEQCFTGVHFTPSQYNNGENGYGFTKTVKYWGGLVKKAGIVVRNPIDIIQTRFIYSSSVYSGNLDWSRRYDQSRKGFLAFCEESKMKYAEFEEAAWPEGLRAQAIHIPCYAEVYKVIQWYNLVCETVDFLNLPNSYFYYEDFSTDYVQSATTLLEFYEMANAAQIDEHDRPDQVRLNQKLYTPTEIEDVMTFIRSMATDCAKTMLARYGV